MLSEPQKRALQQCRSDRAVVDALLYQGAATTFVQLGYKKQVNFDGYILFLLFCFSKYEISFLFVFCFLVSQLEVKVRVTKLG